MRRKPTTVFVYLLGAYVIVQFIWWGYHLIDLTRSSSMEDSLISKRVFMIIGEGSVFLLLLLFGLWKIKTSISKEIRLARQQQNFLLSVTHELKTPVAANKLYLQTLLRHQLPPEKQSELIQKAVEEANRLELLVEQILSAARLEQRAIAINTEEVDVTSLIRGIAEIQEKRFQLPIHLKVAEGLRLKTDRMALATVLNNLIENGHKYGHTERGLELHASVQNGMLQMIIRDFGKGIPADQRQLIFEKFVRLENEETRTTKGTGLGLYIAYQFTRALGGQLRLVTTDEPGACFEIQIPYE